MEVLNDASKKTSSKRVIAFSGFIVMASIAGYAIAKDPSQVGNILWPFAVMIGAMLGATVLEKK